MTAVCCMGGWCAKRNACADHHRKAPVVVERLCEKGRDEPAPMRRFDAWLAGATEEQVKRWEEAQKVKHA